MVPLQNVHWPLVLGLGALALVRPLVRIVGGQLGLAEPPAVAVVVTVVISLVWVGVVGLARVAHPVLTLVLVGLAYAVLSMLLAAVLSPVLDGRAQGPLANPVAIVPVLLTNALWGLLCGVLALGLHRARARRR
jgi:hypothetical protein